MDIIAQKEKVQCFSSSCSGDAITQFKDAICAAGVQTHDLKRAKKKTCTRLVVQVFKSISALRRDRRNNQSLINNYKEQ